VSDEHTGLPTSASAPASEEAAAKKPGFLSTATGRIVAIFAGLGVLGVIAGIAVAILLQGLASQVAEDLVTDVAAPTTPAAGGTTTTETVEAAGPALEIKNSEVFTFRDIFDPLLKPLPEPSATSITTPSATDTETPYAQGVLYLDGVVTEDGILKAQLRYNGTTYTLGPGEGIPGTPWEVLRVSSTSVTMLYGDIQVTLAVGQGITK